MGAAWQANETPEAAVPGGLGAICSRRNRTVSEAAGKVPEGGGKATRVQFKETAESIDQDPMSSASLTLEMPHGRQVSWGEQEPVRKLREAQGKLQEFLAQPTKTSWWSSVRGGQDGSREVMEAASKLIQEVMQAEEDAEKEGAAHYLASPSSSTRSSFHSRKSAAQGRRNSPLFSFLTENSSGTTAPGPVYGSEGEGGDAPMTKTKTETRKWLLATFTTADMEAAEGHEAGCGRNRDLDDSDSGGEDGPVVNFTPSMRRNTQDETITLQLILNKPEFREFFKSAGHLDFDAAAFSELPAVNGKPLQCLGAWAASKFLVKDLVRLGHVPEASNAKFQACLTRFLGEIDELYNNTPYHNSTHAADVVMTMEWFLRTKYMQRQVSTLDHLMVLVAAAIHDVGHPGTSNLFQTKTMSRLAVTYNDKSVLENMHLAKAFETMQSDTKLNWFALLQRAFTQPQDGGEAHAPVNLQQYVRRGLIDMVLATDNAKHPEHVHNIVSILEDSKMEDEPPPSRQVLKMEALENKLHLLECILHAADISNPCKPHLMMLQWTQRILAEFWAQGDKERDLGLDISPMCDREAGQKTVPKGQLGFITFVLLPFYTPLAELIPEVEEATEQLAKTKAFWQKMDLEKVTHEVLFAAKTGGDRSAIS